MATSSIFTRINVKNLLTFPTLANATSRNMVVIEEFHVADKEIAYLNYR